MEKLIFIIVDCGLKFFETIDKNELSDLLENYLKQCYLCLKSRKNTESKNPRMVKKNKGKL